MKRRFFLSSRFSVFVTLLASLMLFTAASAYAVSVDQNNVPLGQEIPGVSAQPEDMQILSEQSGDVITFPATGDTRYTASGTNFWNQGDFVQGTRTFSSIANSVHMVLYIENNVLSCDTQDHVLMIDGTPVGYFSVSAGQTVINESFSFSDVAAGSHTIRIETTRTVDPGCGSAGFPNDVSTLSFSGPCDYCLTDAYGYDWCLNVVNTDGMAYYLMGTVDVGAVVIDAMATYIYDGRRLTMIAYDPAAWGDFTYNTTFISATTARGVWIDEFSGHGHVDVSLVPCGAGVSIEAESAGPAPGEKK